MKKKKLYYTLLVVLILAALIPTAYAFMFRKSQTVQNLFNPATVSCEVVETMVNTTSGGVKSSITVKNTGNVDAYIKVQLVFYWQDSKGVAVGREAPIPDAFVQNYTNADYYNEATKNWVNNGDWIYGGDYIFYYQYPITPGFSTSNLLDKSIILSPIEVLNGNIVYVYNPVVEVIAEAIQSVPVSAVQNSWDVTIVGDGTNANPYTITSANPPTAP